MLERTQRMEMPGAHSHWRYSTISALVPSPSVLLHPQLPPAFDWVAHLGLVLVALKLMAPICGVCVFTVRVLFVYLSVWLLVEDKRGGKVTWGCEPLRVLSPCGRVWVMYWSHTRGLEFGQVEAKFVLHPSKGSSSQAVASNMVRIDGRKLWDARLGCGIRSCWATAESTTTLITTQTTLST